MNLKYFHKNIRINLYCKYLILFFIVVITISYKTDSIANDLTLSISTQNAYNFFNDKNDGKKERVVSSKNYQQRVKRLATHLVKTLDKPNIIALQEIENYSTLNDLNQYIQTNFNTCYKPVLLEGHKKVAINVGYLIDCDYKLKNISQLFNKKKLSQSHKVLFTRPPLYIKVCNTKNCYHLINVHLRSMLGLKNKRKSAYVLKKRLEQAEALASWIQTFQTKWPKQQLIILGDLNALKLSDSSVDVLAIIKASLSKETRNNKTLFDVASLVPKQQRFSYIYKKRKQTLDYALITQNLVSQLKSVKYSSINYKVSDHAALTVTFKPQ